MFPKNPVPQFRLTVPSTKKEHRFRPYLSGEEKLLFMGLASDDRKDFLNVICQMIDNCMIDKLDVKKLPLFDVEYIMNQLRAKSYGETVEITFLGRNPEDTDCDRCTQETIVKIDLNKVSVQFPEGHTNKIMLTEGIGLIMRYPTVEDEIRRLDRIGKETSIDDNFEEIIDSIEAVFDENGVYPTKDSSREELTAWLDTCPHDTFAKIWAFLETIPRLKHEVNMKCKKCGHERVYTFDGYEDFFD